MSNVAGVWDVTTGLQSNPLRDLSEFVSLAEGLDHPEGVAAGPDGAIFAGGEAGQVYKVQADGTWEQIASVDGFALGLALDGDSNIYVCENTSHTVKRVGHDG